MCCDNEAPDTSGINEAARANAEIAKEALNFYKGIYASDILPAQKKQQELADRLVGDYLDTSDQQKRFAEDQKGYYERTFKPVEERTVRDAMDYDSDANVRRASGEAAANVNQQFSNQRAQNARLAGRYGLSSTAFSGPAGMSERAAALASAGAATGAASQMRDKGIALRSGVANFGRNMPNTASNYFSGANSSNSAAFGTGQQSMQNIGQNAAVMGQGFSTFMQGNNSAGGLYGQVASLQNQANANDNAWMGMAGAALGGWAGGGFKMPTSDVNAKKDISRLSDDEALSAVKSTPVSRWTYKEGRGDGGSHVGPMAQDVQKNMGNDAAPDGTKIDLITLNGVNMAATSALARKVERLERKIEGN